MADHLAAEWLKPTGFRPVRLYLTGVEAGFKGLAYPGSLSLWNLLSHRLFLRMAAGVLAVSALLYLLLILPLQLALSLLSFFFPVLEDNGVALGFWELVGTIFFALPSVYSTLLCYPFWHTLDAYFLEALGVQESSTKQAISSLPFPSIWSALFASAIQTCKGLFIVICMRLGSFLPLVGWLVYPLSQVWLCSRLTSLRVACSIAALSLLLPIPPALISSLVSMGLSAMGLSQGLLASYFQRLPRAIYRQSMANKDHKALLLGLGSIATLMMSIPLVGPLFFPAFVAAAGFLTPRLHADDRLLV